MKFLAGEGRVVEAMKRVDWAAHPLGPVDGWSPALRSTLYTVLNSISPKMLLWGADLVTFYNDACAELIDRGGCLGIGSRYPDFRPGLWPTVRASVEAALAGQGSVVHEFRTGMEPEGPSADGVYQLFFSPVLDEDRAVAGVLIDIFDLTARKVLEEDLLGEIALLNGLFSTTPVLIGYATAPDLRLEYVNAAFRDLLGDRPLIGRTVAEAVPEAAEQGFLDILTSVLQSGRAWEGRDVAVSIAAADGGPPRLRYLDFVYHPMLAGDGSISGILFSGYDVTDRRTAREESERLRHQLLHAARMSAMGTMAVTIAHELNQPLTAAANYLSLAEFNLRGSDGVRPGDIATLGAAREQVLRAGSIVKRMRSLVAGRATPVGFDLRKSINRAVELLCASRDLEHMDVEVEIAPDAERASGDYVQIEQVLVNILRNAARAAAGSADPRARITAVRRDGSVEVAIRDWGPGIPGDRIETLFTSLQEPSAGGLGVGLSLCRTIVEAHGGEIRARNCPDGGALFAFTLPAEEEGA